MIEALRGLTQSRKAIVLVVVIAGLAVMVQLGLISSEQFIGTIKVIVPGWMVAHAGEQGAKAIADGKARSDAG